jgi:hypothetical protein
MDEFPLIDACTEHLKQIRSAAATPESRFEERFKDMRAREFARQRTAIEASIAAAPLPRFTAAELAECAAPDPWGEEIRAMQARDARAREAKERSR